jgi:DNA-binding NtrC family response regulator
MNNAPIRYIEGFNLEQLEKQAILEAIEFTKGNLTEALKLLGIARQTLYRKVEYYNIDVKAIRGKNDTVRGLRQKQVSVLDVLQGK